MNKFTHAFILGLLLSVVFPNHSAGQPNESIPLSFEKFYKKDTTTISKGYYTIYSLDDKYYLQIPTQGLGKDILITAQTTLASSAFVSPSSGVIRLVNGREHKLDLIRVQTSEISADSTDWNMMEALRKSGLTPIVRSFDIVAYGPDGKSPIIELTSELNSASGIFNVSSFFQLNKPDPTRSGVLSQQTIDHGALFCVKRTQTDYSVDPQTQHGKETNSTLLLEMIIQEIPNHSYAWKKKHSAYGFNTISKMEYDTKRYAAFKQDYIQHWSLEGAKNEIKKQDKGETISPVNPICVYIDTLVPAPFVESVKNAVKAWNAPFLKAGWKNVFRISQDAKDGALSYHKILFKWGSAYNDNNFSLITNPDNGEILCARVNLMDEKAKELLGRYLLQCSRIDNRIEKDLFSLEIRKEILSVQMEALLANVLGLRNNFAASSTFSLENIRSEKWLNEYGTSASITSGITFNYMLKLGDKISIRNLMPRISTYDFDAINYAYGKSNSAPTIKASYYADEDKNDPYAMNFFSNDIIEASKTGMESLQLIFPKINFMVHRLPQEQNTWSQVENLTKVAFSLHSAYIYQIGKMVGGRSQRPIIPGLNEKPVNFVPKSEQLKALEYLKTNLFTEIPQWLINDSLMMATQIDIKERVLGTVSMELNDLLSKATINSLVQAERVLGKNAFTCEDLFSYFNHVIFKDFNPSQQLTSYQRDIQASLVNQLLNAAKENNITGGVTDESALIHTYLLSVAEQIGKLCQNQVDVKSKQHFELMKIKFNREYFDKQN